MFKEVTLALYQLKRHIEAIPDNEVRSNLLSECEQMHHYMMSACMIQNESKNFMLKSPLGVFQQEGSYGYVVNCTTNPRYAAA